MAAHACPPGVSAPRGPKRSQPAPGTRRDGDFCFALVIRLSFPSRTSTAAAEAHNGRGAAAKSASRAQRTWAIQVDGTITVRILRSPATEGAAPRFQTFRVERAPKMSVLDAVAKIQSSQDSGLAFRYSCRAGMCGTCSMRVNGKNRWTCRTLVEGLKTDTITLEPLPNYPVIRDLAVDMKPFFDNYRKALPHFLPGSPGAEGFARIPRDAPERREIDQHVECITCGNCFGACSLVGTNGAYLGPAALNRAYALICDSRDGAARERLDILNAHAGVWGCHTQFNCSDACPMGISPTRAIQKLKRKEIRHAFTRYF